MNRKAVEIRCMTAEVRASPNENSPEKAPVFTGYAAKYNVLSEDLGGFRERIAPGAFAGCIGRDDVRCLVNHDPNLILGRNTSGTMVLEDRPEGLWFEAEGPNTTWAKDYAISMQRGDVNQCSFRFYVKRDSWETDHESGVQIRTILEVDQLLDVSIVTFPAYPDTDAAARAAGADKALENVRRKAHFANLRRKIDITEKEI